jgi:hypothetical protein
MSLTVEANPVNLWPSLTVDPNPMNLGPSLAPARQPQLRLKAAHMQTERDIARGALFALQASYFIKVLVSSPCVAVLCKAHLYH